MDVRIQLLSRKYDGFYRIIEHNRRRGFSPRRSFKKPSPMRRHLLKLHPSTHRFHGQVDIDLAGSSKETAKAWPRMLAHRVMSKLVRLDRFGQGSFVRTMLWL